MAQITTEDLSAANLASIGSSTIQVILNGDGGPGTPSNVFVKQERYGYSVANDENYTLWFLNDGKMKLKTGVHTTPNGSGQSSGFIIGELVNGALAG